MAGPYQWLWAPWMRLPLDHLVLRMMVLTLGPALLLLLTIPLLWIRTAGTRTAAHGIWWMTLVLGLLNAVAYGGGHHLELLVPTAAMVALLVAPRVFPTGRFQPVAMGRILLAAVVITTAQAGFTLSRAPLDPSAWTVGIPLALGAWGLFRLRGWALVVGLLAQLAVLGVSVTAIVADRGGVEAWIYGASALVVLPVLGLVLVAALRGRAPALPVPPAWAGRLRPVAIVAPWALAMWAVLGGNL
jgi:hypothetical protein